MPTVTGLPSRLALAALTVACSSAVGAQAPATADVARLTEGGRAAIVTLYGDPTSSAEGAAALTRLLGACGRMAELGEPARAAVAAQFAGASPLATDEVRFVVLPLEAVYVDCNDEVAQHTLAAARLVRFVQDTTDIEKRRIVEARLVHQDGSAIAARSELLDVVYAGRWGQYRALGQARALTAKLDDLAPPRGVSRTFSLLVRHPLDTLPYTVHLGTATVDAVWDAALAERAARVGAPAQLTSLLHDPLSRARLAAQFADRGDMATAAVLYQGALARRPCLSTRDDAPPAVRRLDTDVLHPEARCTAMPMTRLVLRSLLLPGFGREPTREQHIGRRIVVPVGIALFSAVGFQKDARARDAYRDYLDANTPGYPPLDPTTVGSRYGVAADARRQSVNAYRTAAAIWLGSTTIDLVLEHFFAKRIAADRGAVTSQPRQP